MPAQQTDNTSPRTVISTQSRAGRLNSTPSHPAEYPAFPDASLYKGTVELGAAGRLAVLADELSARAGELGIASGAQLQVRALAA